MFTNALLTLGLLFPVLSWLTAVAASVHRRTTGHNSSPVFVPMIGPILLTSWIFAAGHSPLWIPAVWLLDLGTVAFAFAMPRIIREEWPTPRFNPTKELHGTAGNESVILTLRRDCYVLKKSWTRIGDPNAVGWGEPGTYVDHGDRIDLIAHRGRRRELQRIDEGSYRVFELDVGTIQDDPASLDGWLLQIR